MESYSASNLQTEYYVWLGVLRLCGSCSCVITIAVSRARWQCCANLAMCDVMSFILSQ